MVPTNFKFSGQVLATIFKAIKEIGEYQVLKQNPTLSSQAKHDNSPVTEVDLYSDRKIKTLLRDITPDVFILSEETPEQNNFKISSQPQFWCIDPLDGTRDYLEGTQNFAINLALFKNSQVIWGLIHHPASGEFLVSNRETHTVSFFDKDGLETAAPLPLSTNSIDKILTSSRVKLLKNHVDHIKSVAPHLSPRVEILPVSSSYKFFALLAQRAQAYLRKSPCMIWDVAPGFLAAELAGMPIYNMKTLEPFEWPTHALEALGPFAIFTGHNKIH